MSLKRALSINGRSVSPPATRRKFINHSVEQGSAPADSLPALSSERIRIYSWNVNGVGPLLQKPLSFTPSQGIFPLRSFLKRHGWPQLLCLQEVKISANDFETQRKLENSANFDTESDGPAYSAHFSLPRDKYNATGFGGKVHGVATLIRDDFSKGVKDVLRPDWDLEGRVQIIETTRNLVVFNGYWVNGTSNPYRDPTTGIVTGTRHDHKLRFHQHMLDESLKLERQGYHVLLIGDMNIARGRIDGHPNLRTSPEQHVKNRHDFNQKFFESGTGLKGVDVFRHLHGQQQKYTYHPRGSKWGASCDRVDLVIANRTLADTEGAIVGSDICDNPEDRGHSDHVPLWVSVESSKLVSRTGSDPLEGTTLLNASAPENSPKGESKA